jgi:hypothetical protein
MTWGNSISLCKVVRLIAVFTRQQLHCPTAAILAGQLLPQQGGAFHFCIAPLVPWEKLRDPPRPCFVRLACHPTPFSAFVTYPTLVCSKFVSLLHPCSPRQVWHFTPHLLSKLDYNLLFMFFSLVEVQSSQTLHWIMFPEGEWGVACGECCSPVGSGGLCRQLWNQLPGERWCVALEQSLKLLIHGCNPMCNEINIKNNIVEVRTNEMS